MRLIGDDRRLWLHSSLMCHDRLVYENGWVKKDECGHGKSIASSNHYLRAIKMFTRWFVRDRRTGEDRLAHLSKMNAELDRRRVRRPLSMEEFARLLQAAEKGPSIQNIAKTGLIALLCRTRPRFAHKYRRSDLNRHALAGTGF